MSNLIGIILLSSLLMLFSCDGNSRKANNDKRHTLTIAGSTSVMPFVEKLSEHFMVDRPNYTVNVQGGGSTAGVQACLNRTIDIGMSSRPLKKEEMLLNEITVCHDGIAVVVHRKNPIRELSFRQIQGVFSGKIKNWKELGWVDRSIDAVTREEGSGTRGSFEDLVMKGQEIYDGIMVQDSNGSVKEIVATDPYAMGYISLGLVDDRVRSLSIDGVAASIESIRAKQYKVVRPFLFLVNGAPNSTAKAFIDFVLSSDGQNILKKEGLIGIQ
jgi:phosphate transport system substrate-binding protein